MKISGIYEIGSRVKPERIYIGSSVNIQNRWYGHLRDLRNNRHSNKKLQNHYNKYGESDLLLSILLGCDKEDLIKIEQYFLDSCRTYFNVFMTAGSPLGHECSEETKRKISETEKKMGYKNHLGGGIRAMKEVEEIKRKYNLI